MVDWGDASTLRIISEGGYKRASESTFHLTHYLSSSEEFSNTDTQVLSYPKSNMYFIPFQLAGILVLELFLVADAHFVLQIPTSLGFDDDMEGIAPCGGFNITARTNVTSWPIAGGNVGILTVHPSVTWEFKAALSKNLTAWTSLSPILNQIGVGQFCEPQIPAPQSFAGLDGVLQVTQHGPEGDLYQVNMSHPKQHGSIYQNTCCKICSLQPELWLSIVKGLKK